MMQSINIDTPIERIEPAEYNELIKKVKVKDNFNEYHRNYYHDKKHFVLCECGCMIYRYKLNRHLKTKKHQKLVENIKNNSINNFRYYNVKV